MPTPIEGPSPFAELIVGHSPDPSGYPDLLAYHRATHRDGRLVACGVKLQRWLDSTDLLAHLECEVTAIE